MIRLNASINWLRFFVAVGVIVALMLVMQAVSVANAQVVAAAQTAGFGAAFGYAQTIGSVAYTQAGTIGNGAAVAVANTPGYYQHKYNPHTHKYYYTYVPGTNAYSGALSYGNAAAFSYALGTPFGSTAFIQANSLNGVAAAIAGAN